jgi:hypothetical protein
MSEPPRIPRCIEPGPAEDALYGLYKALLHELNDETTAIERHHIMTRLFQVELQLAVLGISFRVDSQGNPLLK